LFLGAKPRTVIRKCRLVARGGSFRSSIAAATRTLVHAERAHRALTHRDPRRKRIDDRRLWDVSIDTLEPYQRRGHATQAAAFLIEHYRGLGKEPVWGALVSNHASRALAARLGFEEVGSLSIFSAPRVVDT